VDRSEIADARGDALVHCKRYEDAIQEYVSRPHRSCRFLSLKLRKPPGGEDALTRPAEAGRGGVHVAPGIAVIPNSVDVARSHPAVPAVHSQAG